MLYMRPMSRSDDPSSSRSAPRKKPTAVLGGLEAPKAAGKAKAASQRAPISFDVDFGVALAIVPTLRRPRDA